MARDEDKEEDYGYIWNGITIGHLFFVLVIGVRLIYHGRTAWHWVRDWVADPSNAPLPPWFSQSQHRMFLMVCLDDPLTPSPHLFSIFT